MAVDKLVDSSQLDADLTSIANAIRTKGGTSAQMAFPAGFVSAVQAIPTGGVTPTGTKQISITQNGTTTEDVTNYANAEITVNVSGGGTSPISKLGEVTVSENVRAVNLDLTPYASYDFIMVFADATLTASDWLYVAKNGSGPSGGTYASSMLEHKGVLYVRGTTVCGRNGWGDAIANNNGMQGGNATVNNLYIYTYTSSKYITAGSKFTVYGGNYADM